MTRKYAFAVAGLLVAAMLGCSTAPKSESGRTELVGDAAKAIALAETQDPTITPVLKKAAGYVVFPTVGKGAIGVGGAYGKGVLYEKGTVVGYSSLTQASIGLALGGQAYTEIICFETKDSLSAFRSGGFTFSAQATAVALASGAGANAKYANGVLVFTRGEEGLMYEASIGGQKFSYEPLAAVP
jgi:lipid-binding SYLF domain-containing protein